MPIHSPRFCYGPTVPHRCPIASEINLFAASPRLRASLIEVVPGEGRVESPLGASVPLCVVWKVQSDAALVEAWRDATLGGLLEGVRDLNQPRLAAGAARERDAVG